MLVSSFEDFIDKDLSFQALSFSSLFDFQEVFISLYYAFLVAYFRALFFILD